MMETFFSKYELEYVVIRKPTVESVSLWIKDMNYLTLLNEKYLLTDMLNL